MRLAWSALKYFLLRRFLIWKMGYNQHPRFRASYWNFLSIRLMIVFVAVARKKILTAELCKINRYCLTIALMTKHIIVIRGYAIGDGRLCGTLLNKRDENFPGVGTIDHGTRNASGRTDEWSVAEWALLYVAPESNPSRFPTTPGNRFLSLSLSLSLILILWSSGLATRRPLLPARRRPRDHARFIATCVLLAPPCHGSRPPCRTIDVPASRFRAPGLSARDIARRACSR